LNHGVKRPQPRSNIRPVAASPEPGIAARPAFQR
jgi:hypothetical protein